MATNLDIANRALQRIGTRVNMTQAEFSGQLSNEAIQLQLVMFRARDELNRMAPWDCVYKWANLTYITSVPTTPENNAGNPAFWQAGTPPPPWAYEYQYPSDCLRAIKIVPQYTAQAGGVPIFPTGTATGAGNIGWTGPALKFRVATDSFYNMTSATVVSGGVGYGIGNLITLTQPVFNFTQNLTPPGLLTPQTFAMNVGAPAVLQVTGVAGSAVTTVSVVNQIYDETTSPSGGTPVSPLSGSYFQVPNQPIAQGFCTGGNGELSNGTGATFNAVMTTSPAPQRVILCNQENAVLCYNAAITDPNVMDPLFQSAWVHVIAAKLAFQISGDKALANQCLAEANAMITEARAIDGNEGLTVNDVTPDWLRTRGTWGGPNWEYSPNLSFDWGSTYSPY